MANFREIEDPIRGHDAQSTTHVEKDTAAPIGDDWEGDFEEAGGTRIQVCVMLIEFSTILPHAQMRWYIVVGHF